VTPAHATFGQVPTAGKGEQSTRQGPLVNASTGETGQRLVKRVVVGGPGGPGAHIEMRPPRKPLQLRKPGALTGTLPE